MSTHDENVKNLQSYSNLRLSPDTSLGPAVARMPPLTK